MLARRLAAKVLASWVGQEAGSRAVCSGIAVRFDDCPDQGTLRRRGRHAEAVILARFRFSVHPSHLASFCSH